MQGKLAVIIILVLTVASLAAGYLFFFRLSPVDQRFRLNRTPVPADSGGNTLLPDHIGDFARVSVENAKPQAGGKLVGKAAYADTDGKKILLTVARLVRPDEPLPILSTAVALASPAPGTVPVFLTDAPFPYSFTTTSRGAQFSWMNGSWLLTASTTEADVETLLQFVNQYDN